MFRVHLTGTNDQTNVTELFVVTIPHSMNCTDEKSKRASEFSASSSEFDKRIENLFDFIVTMCYFNILFTYSDEKYSVMKNSNIRCEDVCNLL